MAEGREDEADMNTGAGTGDGGPTGTPTHDADEKPPSHDQDITSVVSGGGLVDPDEDGDGATAE